MAYLLTNLPTDIRNIIDEKVKELPLTTGRLLCQDRNTMTCYIYEIIGWHTDEEHVGIMDEDYGSPDYETDKCETADLNRFVDDFKIFLIC